MASVFFLEYGLLHLIFLFHRDESFLFAASPLTPKLHVWIHDHKTIGKDKEIGEGDVDVSLFFFGSLDTIVLFMNSITDLASYQTRGRFVRRSLCRTSTRRHPATAPGIRCRSSPERYEWWGFNPFRA